MAGLPEKVFPFLFHKSDQNAKGARSQTTASGSTTRVRGVAFSSVAETFGEEQSTLTLDQSENLLPCSNICRPQEVCLVLERSRWGGQGLALWWRRPEQRCRHIHSFTTQAAPSNPWLGSWQSSSLPSGSTNSLSTVSD